MADECLFFSCAQCDAVFNVVSFVLFSLQRKLLAIYLHHDQSIFSNVFCSQVLCAESLVSFLSVNFVIWAWDLTHASNREKYVHRAFCGMNFLYCHNNHDVTC